MLQKLLFATFVLKFRFFGNNQTSSSSGELVNIIAVLAKYNVKIVFFTSPKVPMFRLA
jgi:hypothetical protein